MFVKESERAKMDDIVEAEIVDKPMLDVTVTNTEDTNKEKTETGEPEFVSYGEDEPIDHKKYSSSELVYDHTDLKGVMNAFMTEIIHWTWTDMLELKNNPDTAIIYNTVITLVRVCAEGKVSALKMMFDRIDGRVEQPINIIKPKIYLRYPNATNDEELERYLEVHEKENTPEGKRTRRAKHKRKQKLNIASLGLSETLQAMMRAPIDLPGQILKSRILVERMLERGETPEYSPYVKVVLCAALITNANFDDNYEALQMLFERIEGKIENTIKVIGEDMYIDQYDTEAPMGSVLVDGQWCFEDKNITNQWVEGFLATKKNLELEDD